MIRRGIIRFLRQALHHGIGYCIALHIIIIIIIIDNIKDIGFIKCGEFND
jgi:hypothetical protein